MDVLIIAFLIALCGLLISSPFLINRRYKAALNGKNLYGVKSALAGILTLGLILALLAVVEAANNVCGVESGGAVSIYGSYSVMSGQTTYTYKAPEDVSACMGIIFSRHDNIIVSFVLLSVSMLYILIRQFRRIGRESNYLVSAYLVLVMPFLSIFYLMSGLFIIAALMSKPKKTHI